MCTKMSEKKNETRLRWCKSAPSMDWDQEKSDAYDNVFIKSPTRSSSFKQGYESTRNFLRQYVRPKRKATDDENTAPAAHNLSMSESDRTSQTTTTSADVMNKGDKSLIAYGVKYLEEKPDKLRLLRINPKARLQSLSKLRSSKSLSDADSGFDSADSSSASSSGNASSPTSSESSVTLETDAPQDEDGWLEGGAYNIENLAMSGGGAKGYAYIGALKALEDANVLRKIRRIVGTSAGAVIAGMLVVGGTPQEIADFFACDVKKLFQDKNAALCLFLPRLLTKFGVNSGQRFYEIYGAFLLRKTGNPDITFEEVHHKYGKELCVTVTNLSRMRSEFCHHTTTPDLPIRTAVKISMAFPGVYESMKTDLFGNGPNLYVDGGTLENFPVQYFDKIDEDTNKPIYNDKTVGLYLMSEDQFSHKIWQETFREAMESFPSYLPNTKLAKERLKDELRRRKKRDKDFDPEKRVAELMSDPYILPHDGKAYMRHYEASNKEQIDIKGPRNYFKAMLSTLLISQKHLMVQPADVKRTIGINCGYIDTKDTGVQPGDREFMIRQGYEHTRNFLKMYIANKGRSKTTVGAHTPRQSVRKPTSLPAALTSVNFTLGDTPSPSPSEEPSLDVPLTSRDVPLTSHPVAQQSKSHRVALRSTSHPLSERSPNRQNTDVQTKLSPHSTDLSDLCETNCTQL